MNAHSVSLGTWGKAFGSLGPCLVKEWVENAIVWGSGSARPAEPDWGGRQA